uniref:Uncharacterized protein n=1 Tax=Picea sitchensis TaxID=3332 RepID=A0A6B9XRQ2_PICSI|nr:hypothetical protein Q903MT_gene6655 [Picea sitchensis]
MKHMLWDCQFSRSCWDHVRTQHSALLQGRVHWRSVLFGDSRSLVHSSFSGIWHCMRISSLFVLWKIRCVFFRMRSAFCQPPSFICGGMRYTCNSERFLAYAKMPSCGSLMHIHTLFLL